MYTSEGRAPDRIVTPFALLRARLRVGANVWWLGATSLATDVSSEMLTAILPLYLVAQHGLSPMAFGAIDGLHQGLSSVVRWVSGYTGDRLGRHKEMAALGYGLSAITRVGWLIFTPAASTMAALVGTDRVGKGLRTAPRDALISLSGPPGTLGYAFGVHRAMDAAGVMAGPLVAFAILSNAPDRFDRVFAASLAAALVGLTALFLGVRNPSPLDAAAAPPPPPGVRASLAVLGDAGFRRIVLLGTALSLMSVSDPFLYLALRAHSGFPSATFPLLFAVTGLSYLVWAIPAGLLADRWGRRAVLVLGHVALLAVYAFVVWPLPGPVWMVSILLGAYYAATDGVLTAMAGTRLPPAVMGSGLALLGTATSLARLAASLTVGWAWTLMGPTFTIIGAGAGLALVLVVCVPAIGAITPERQS